jgi:hypothetical protein
VISTNKLAQLSPTLTFSFYGKLTNISYCVVCSSQNGVQTTTLKFYDTMDNNSLRKKCAKAWCKTIIPLDAKFKACDSCRTRDQDAQKKKRSREKAAVTTRVSTGSKRSQENVSDAEERPARRARFDNDIVEVLGGTLDSDEDEDDEDDLFGESNHTASYFVISCDPHITY